MRIVIKIGTSTLTAGLRELHLPTLHKLCQQVAALAEQGHSIVIVSSGAVACGRQELNYPKLAAHLPAKQMLAAIGQGILMQHYRNSLQWLGQRCAQILLTRADISDRARYLNARNTFAALEQQGVIAIVNENDTLATEEIRVGDNDQLAALVANLIQAEKLLLLTDQEGLYTANPRTHPQAELIRSVQGAPTAELYAAAGAPVLGAVRSSPPSSHSSTSLGTGGMLTKLKSAEAALAFGCEVIIANGARANVIAAALFDPTLPCTRFIAAEHSPKESRKRYLLAQQSAGRVMIDPGAANALLQGKSLLAVGIVAIHGQFDLGDPIDVLSATGARLARGLSRYSSAELQLIAGTDSKYIRAKLGFSRGREALHRDDLVLY